MKIFNTLFVLIMLISFSASANNLSTGNYFNERAPVENINNGQDFAENIMFLIDEIDKKDYLNFEKKEILKQKVIFIYKSILVADSEEVFIRYLISDFFNLSLCLPYFIREDSDNEVQEILNNFVSIEDDLEIERYEKIHNIIYSQEISELGLEYVSENASEINNICYDRSSFSKIEDIVLALDKE